MDLEVVLLIGAAVVGIVVGVLHLVGYVPPRYRKMLKEVQADTAKAIGEAIDARLASLSGEDGSEGPEPFAELKEALAALREAITQVAPHVGIEVKNAMVQAQTEFAAEMAKQVPESLAEVIPASVRGAIGGTVMQSNRRSGELRNAVGQGLLGPYGALLQQFMPPLYEYLVENPDMVVQALEMPVVQKLIQKAAAMAGQLKGVGTDTGNPFLGELGR